VPLVERRRLERERHQHDLRAAAPARLLLGRAEEVRTEPSMAPRLLHPELPHFAGAAPGVAADAGDDAVGVIANEDGEPLAVRDAGDARVELVDAVFQVLDIIGRRLDGDHGRGPSRSSLPRVSRPRRVAGRAVDRGYLPDHPQIDRELAAVMDVVEE